MRTRTATPRPMGRRTNESNAASGAPSDTPRAAVFLAIAREYNALLDAQDMQGRQWPHVAAQCAYDSHSQAAAVSVGGRRGSGRR